MAVRVVTADEAAKLVESGDTLLIGGSGAGHSVPDALIAAIGSRFRAEGEPRSLTTVHPVGLGDRANRGIAHLAHAGLLKRVVCGTLVDSPPVERMAVGYSVAAPAFAVLCAPSAKNPASSTVAATSATEPWT